LKSKFRSAAPLKSLINILAVVAGCFFINPFRCRCAAFFYLVCVLLLLFPRSNSFLPVSVAAILAIVALTFDDGPEPTTSILELLDNIR